jgi:Flp pilus assembly protein TadG
MSVAASTRGWREYQSTRQRGQALVEFGLVVVLFVFLVSGMFDLGLLLNARLAVSSMSRVLARAAAAGDSPSELQALARQQDGIPGVTTGPFNGYCCTVNINNGRTVLSPHYAIVVNVTYTNALTQQPRDPPIEGDWVTVTVNAEGAQVLTPLMRPIFGCTGSQTYCPVTGISAQTTMRVEPIPT